MNVAVIDYGAGNLQSVANALDRLGQRFFVGASPRQLLEAERIILPGVGHFGAAGRSLAADGTAEAIRDAAARGVPVLGICLGAQILARALGARVHAAEEREISWHPVRLLEAAARSPLAGLPSVVTPFHWHGETFTLPDGAVRLAETDRKLCASSTITRSESSRCFMSLG